MARLLSGDKQAQEEARVAALAAWEAMAKEATGAMAGFLGGEEPAQTEVRVALIWPLHDIAIANIVWCMAQKKRGRWGGVYCAMGVQ